MSAANAGRWLAIAASVVVVATIVAAMLAMGSPASQRESRMDRKREQDLQRIAMLIDGRAEQGRPLPADLASLAREPGRRMSITDPATDAPYEYRTTGDRDYLLCAVFATDTAQESRPAWMDQEWEHGKGRHCFNRRTDAKKD
ncbi:MAG: hypothetical protein ABWX88_04470 [Pseudoxanthomonas sp.]